MSDVSFSSAPGPHKNIDELRVAWNADIALCRLRTIAFKTSANNNEAVAEDVDAVFLEGGTYTIKVPASPTVGTRIVFVRQTTGGSLTINANGSVFNGGASTAALGGSVGASFEVVWSGDATMGWWS